MFSMAQALAPLPKPASSPTPDVLDAIAKVAWTLEPVAPHERAGLLRDEAAQLVDGLLVRVARGLGALDCALGEALDALCGGGHLMRFGASNLPDYARERLGMPGGTARNLVRLSRALRSRPLLRAAVRAGEVTARKAETILRVAVGDDEAAWVERARTDTVRALAAAVRAGGGTLCEDDDHADEPRDRVVLALAPDERARLDVALELARALLPPGSPPWRRVEVVCEEYLGEHPIEVTEMEREAALPRSFLEWERDLQAMKEGCEYESRRWEALAEPERFEAPVGGGTGGAPVGPAGDADALDARARELAAMRDRWDALVGHLGMLVQSCGLWRHLFFANLDHYAEERLGMSGRALAQRAALERRLFTLPLLRRAMAEGRLSYEKARLVATHADERTVAELIARAEGLTAIALRRELEGEEEAQMCGRGELAVFLPRRVAGLLSAAIRAARDDAGTWLTPGQALARIADHFLVTYVRDLERLCRAPRTPAQRAMERDGGRCTFPGCSRPALQSHHIVFRSRGGTDDETNLTPLCPGHHLHGVHGGYLRVTGKAPGALRWELTLPPTS